MRRWCLTSTPRWRAIRFLFLLVASAAAACVFVLSQMTEKRSTRHKTHHSAPNATFPNPFPAAVDTDTSSSSSSSKTTSSSRHYRLPSSIVIGVRKGGTRALLDMAALHSRVRPARAEVHFFDADDNYARGLEWYRRQMPPVDAERGEMAVEKTPSYFNTESVPERVRRMDPRVLLLLVVRDPVTRLISDYTQIMHNHVERGLAPKSFEELVFLNNATQEVNTRYDAVGKSMYDVHMRRWLKHFPLEQIHVVNGDRLIRKPWQELNKVENFLGLDREITPDQFYFNRTKGFHCVRGGWGRDGRRAGGDRCLTKSKGRRHPDVSPQAVSALRRFYVRHNYAFYDLVGRDFGWPEE